MPAIPSHPSNPVLQGAAVYDEQMITPSAAPLRRDDDVDLRSLFGALMDHKWIILMSIAFAILLGLIYLMLATPKYEARAVVQVDQQMMSVPGIDAGEGALLPGTVAATEVQLLTSRSVVGQAVGRLGLATSVSPVRFPIVGAWAARRHEGSGTESVASPWFGLDSYGWGGERLDIADIQVPNSLLNKPMRLIAGQDGRYTLLDGSGGQLLTGRVGEFARGSGISMMVSELRANPGTRFDVRRSDPLPHIDRLRGQLVATEQGRESGVIRLTYAASDPEQARAVLEQITAAYITANIKRNSAEADKSMRFVQTQLPKVRAELEQAQTALNDYQNEQGAVDIEQQTSSYFTRLNTIDASLQQLRIEQADVSSRFTSLHPAKQALVRQIGALESEKSALQQRIADLPNLQRDMLRLTRDVEVINQTYTNLLDQAQKFDIARASAVGSARVVDAPDVNAASPTWPKAPLVLAVAAGLGAILSIIAVLLWRVLKRGVEDADEIEQLGLPVFASIPRSGRSAVLPDFVHARRDDSPRLLTLGATEGAASEAMRGLRTNLQVARGDSHNGILMITSPVAGAGKSFVASNLAATIAQAGQKVLLIDADMRHGNLHRVLGQDMRASGLSELLSGKATLEQSVRKVSENSNLWLITRGGIPSNPSELLMQPNFGHLLRDLADQYDYVVIDTPPVLAVTDAAVIGTHVGSAMMVLRYGMHRTDEIVRATQRLRQSGTRVSGAIFNAVRGRAAHGYGDGYASAAS